MADQDSRTMAGQETVAHPRGQVDQQRAAEEGIGGGGGGRQGSPGNGSQPASRYGGATVSDPDVVLQIPRVKVDELYLEVDNLDAQLSLRSRLANLLQLDVGVQAHLGTVKLDIKGVETEALLEVRLEELSGILDRALSTIDRNPQILESVVKAADTAVNQVGQTAQQALGPQGPLSQTLQQLRDAAAAAGDNRGAGGGVAGSSARAAWQQMKRVLDSNQQLRQVTARLLGPPGEGQQHGE